MRLKKRGYFFVIDAMLGLAVIIVGVFLITASYSKIPQPTQVSFLADDLMNFLANTKIKDLNDPYAGIGGELWDQGIITDGENSLLQQAGIFYKTNNLAVAHKFIGNVTIGVVPSPYRYEVWIDSTILYPNPQPSGHNSSKNNTQLLLTSKQITFGIMNTTTSDIFGPYKAEVFVWER